MDYVRYGILMNRRHANVKRKEKEEERKKGVK
jgi:hypothetical protein